VGELDREAASPGGTRPTRAHRLAARCRTLARSENRPRVRAEAVRIHDPLCSSSVGPAPGPSCLLSNVTYQPESPARVLLSEAPARSQGHPRWRVGLVGSSMRNFLAGVIAGAARPYPCLRRR